MYTIYKSDMHLSDELAASRALNSPHLLPNDKRKLSRPVRGNYTDFVRQKELKMENWKKKYDLQETGTDFQTLRG